MDFIHLQTAMDPGPTMMSAQNHSLLQGDSVSGIHQKPSPGLQQSADAMSGMVQ